MKIINRDRGSGKTSIIICTAYATGNPIITHTMSQKNNLLNTAKRMGMANEIEVYSLAEWLNTHKRDNHKTDVLIDEVGFMIGDILSEYLNANVVAGTMTVPMADMENNK